MINFLVNGICKNSFGPWAFENGPNTPVTMNCDLGNYNIIFYFMSYKNYYSLSEEVK